MSPSRIWPSWLGGDAVRRGPPPSMVGSSLARSIAIVHGDLDVDADPEVERGIPDRADRRAVRDRPGLEARRPRAAREVRAAGLAAALVTSTHRGLTEIALDVIGREFFAATVCGDEVGRPKPRPEPYLRAAALLGRRSGACVADRGFAARDRLGRGGRLRGAGRAERGADRPPRRLGPSSTSLVGVDVAYLRQLV